MKLFQKMKEKKRGKKKENLCYPRSMRFSSIIIIGCTPDKSVCGGACGMLSSLRPIEGDVPAKHFLVYKRLLSAGTLDIETTIK